MQKIPSEPLAFRRKLYVISKPGLNCNIIFNAILVSCKKNGILNQVFLNRVSCKFQTQFGPRFKREAGH